jgi:hypothetical protein
MTGDAPGGDLLRALVREVLADLVREALPAGGTRPGPPTGVAPEAADPFVSRATGVAPEAGHTLVPRARGGYAPPAPSSVERARADPGRVEDVVVRDDRDLRAFAERLLALYENPENRRDVRNGQLRFRLAGGAPQPAAAAAEPVERIERGAVTERHVKRAAESGSRLVLGRSAVLTPLAREKARTLGVPVEKER